MTRHKRFRDHSKFKRGLFITLAALGLSVFVYLFSGTAPIESWVASQLLTFGGKYLQPELHFDRVTFRRPRTVLVDNLTIFSPDPAHPGQSINILAVKRVRLELAEIPRRGKQIKISEVILESPEFRAIAQTPGSRGLVGYSHLLKTSAVMAPATDAAATIPATTAAANIQHAPPPKLLSDVLFMRRVEISHGLIRYDPRLPNTQPMQLDDINARLDLTPSHDTPGLYAVETTITRQPIFKLDVKGQFNLDTLTAELTTLALNLDMRQENAHFLPPEIQQLLNTFEITGELRVSASGTIPLTNIRQSTLHTSAELTGAGFATGAYRFRADSFTTALDVANGVATIQKADARLLGGEVHLTGTIPLDTVNPARLELSTRDIQIEQTLRAADPKALPQYAGKVAAQITFTAPLAQWRTQASGNGTLTLRQGRIHNTPVLGEIITGIGRAGAKPVTLDAQSLTDIADADFTLHGDHAQIDHLTAISGGLGIRGGGLVNFHQQLDLRLNAGPMEALQGALGDLGKAWAAASDSMAGYRVTGTLAQPHVAFEVGDRPQKK